MPSYSGVWTLTAQFQAKGSGNWPIAPLGGDIGLFAGGYTVARVNTIQYITITSTGNAIDFGDLTRAVQSSASCASSTRGVWGGGTPDGSTAVNIIDYVTINTLGNAIDFGDLTASSRISFNSSWNASFTASLMIFLNSDGFIIYKY